MRPIPYLRDRDSPTKLGQRWIIWSGSLQGPNSVKTFDLFNCSRLCDIMKTLYPTIVDFLCIWIDYNTEKAYFFHLSILSEQNLSTIMLTL